jgi:hypothetical protein
VHMQTVNQLGLSSLLPATAVAEIQSFHVVAMIGLLFPEIIYSSVRFPFFDKEPSIKFLVDHLPLYPSAHLAVLKQHVTSPALLLPALSTFRFAIIQDAVAVVPTYPGTSSLNNALSALAKALLLHGSSSSTAAHAPLSEVANPAVGLFLEALRVSRMAREALSSAKKAKTSEESVFDTQISEQLAASLGMVMLQADAAAESLRGVIKHPDFILGEVRRLLYLDFYIFSKF